MAKATNDEFLIEHVSRVLGLLPPDGDPDLDVLKGKLSKLRADAEAGGCDESRLAEFQMLIGSHLNTQDAYRLFLYGEIRKGAESGVDKLRALAAHRPLTADELARLEKCQESVRTAREAEDKIMGGSF